MVGEVGGGTLLDVLRQVAQGGGMVLEQLAAVAANIAGVYNTLTAEIGAIVECRAEIAVGRELESCGGFKNVAAAQAEVCAVGLEIDHDCLACGLPFVAVQYLSDYGCGAQAAGCGTRGVAQVDAHGVESFGEVATGLGRLVQCHAAEGEKQCRKASERPRVPT